MINIQLNNNNIVSVAFNRNILINFTNKQKVLDEIRGYLIYDNNSWCFVGCNQYLFMQRSQPFNKLALILESPHKDEYSPKFTPLRPANGKTGENINLKLHTRSFIQNLNTSFDYEVYLMNPIQFQCSCYCFLTNNSNSTITKKIFRALFNKNKGNLRNDFIKRLQNYNPEVVLNASTSGLKQGVVKSAINEALKNIQYYEDNHPSVW